MCNLDKKTNAHGLEKHIIYTRYITPRFFIKQLCARLACEDICADSLFECHKTHSLRYILFIMVVVETMLKEQMEQLTKICTYIYSDLGAYKEVGVRIKEKR
jgi:hypothetical protein